MGGDGMRTCDDFRESLLLDVHGEVSREEGEALVAHLESCEPCRRRRAQVAALLARVREAAAYPEPTSAEAEALRAAILRSLRGERQRQGRRWTFLGLSLPPVPALAAACLLVVAAVWFGAREADRPPESPALTHLGSEERLIVQNLDILEDLDLLEEMDVLQTLIQVVDRKDSVL
jgi:anti-sigma factor RsiW